MKHLVQYSTGTTSAEVARIVIEAHGLDDVILITADTLIEDPDNWRFAHEAHEWLGSPAWVKLTDGRHPMQAGRDARAIPNTRWDICSRVLKRELIRGWLEATYHPRKCIVYLGFDWWETERWEGAQRHWPPFRVAAPLMDTTLDKRAIFDLWRARGIEIPRLNREGFPHANCGGGCVKAGMSEWDRLRRLHPDRFAWWEAQEQETRDHLGKNVTILRSRRGGTSTPVTLRTFRERQEMQPELFTEEDTGACACDAYRADDPPVATSAKYTVEWLWERAKENQK